VSGDAERELLKDALLTIRALKADLKSRDAELKARDAARREPIAIIGIGCRFPGGANTPDAFWELLRDGVDAVREMPTGRWNADAFYHPDPDAPGKTYVRHGAFLDDVRGFDAEFFGITPREAARLDPQQRLLLETSWEALEDAGLSPDTLGARPDGAIASTIDSARGLQRPVTTGVSTGVFIGAMSTDYGHRQAHRLEPAAIDPYMLAGNDLSFAAGRLAYVLGLHGPAMVVSTACSSSLVSVHLASQALRNGECDLALAGGVNVVLDPTVTVMLSKLRALARDGRCKTFDADADGYGRGEGCGMIVLERLSDAIARGHRVLAVVRGSAVNHDGASAGLTVPNGRAQEDLLRRALAAADVTADDVSYVEAHGTGTSLGDPIEVQALARVIGPRRGAPLRIGSVKTNIGHLEPAAGIAGLIKVVLSLRHQTLPPHLHFRRPNPHVAWDSTPIEVVTAREEWKPANGRRVAGVSSFGLSGVNAHVILEEAPATSQSAASAAATRSRSTASAGSAAGLASLANSASADAGSVSAATCAVAAERPLHILTISGHTEAALAEQVARYQAYLATHAARIAGAAPKTTGAAGTCEAEHAVNATAAWADICFTATTGRRHFAHRVAIVADSTDTALACLADVVAARNRDTGVVVKPTAAERHANDDAARQAVEASIETSSRSEETWRPLLERIAELYARGADIDWTAFNRNDASSRAIVTLPVYAFQRQDYWALDDAAIGADASSQDAASDRAADAAAVGAGRTAAAHGVARTEAASDDWRKQLAAVGGEQRVALIGNLVERAVKAVIGYGSHVPLNRERSLFDLGLDSLMSLELRDRVRANAGVELPLSQLFADATIGNLAARLLESIDAEAPSEQEAAPAPVAAVASATPLVAAAPAAVTLPLSYGQKALWFIHQSHPASPAYNVGVSLRMRGEVDDEAMRRAFQTLVDRHPSLRTVFSVEGDEPCQRILAEQPVNFRVVNTSDLADDELTARVQEDYRQPFNLTTGPLLRVVLYRQSATSHVLLIAMHHIVCDAMSCWTLLGQLRDVYTRGASESVRHATGEAIDTNTYAEFVAWQQAMVGGTEGERQWQFWREQFSGELPMLDVPVDRPRPPMQTQNGASHVLTVPEALSDAIRALARTERATLHATLLAAFQVLLHRYTGQDDILVGTATAARPRQFAGCVGYFVNPVVIRATLAGDTAFDAVLDQVRARTIAAIEHQHYPFPLLVERLQPKRDPSRSPIVQADFSLAQTPPAFRDRAALASGEPHAGAAGLEFERFPLAEEEGQFDLGLHVTDDGGPLVARFKYNADLFERETMARMAKSFRCLLEAIAANPKEQIGALRLLSDGERQRLIAAGTGPSVTLADIDTFVHDKFERQVELTPDAIAVECVPASSSPSPSLSLSQLPSPSASPAAAGEGGRVRLTYRELNRRANQLAHDLRDCGVGPDTLVGVCLTPSIDLVVALLAVLKAGGAYLPLDPAYPVDRLAFMVRDAGIRILLTTHALKDRLPAEADDMAIYLDDEEEIAADGVAARAAGRSADENPVRIVASDHLAYVIYTSGSTGLPKGAMITHGGLGNYLSWALDAYRVAEGSCAPVNSSIAFDATITSFFAPLLAGGRVILLPEDGVIETLAEVLRTTSDVSLVKITPAHLEVLAQQLAPELSKVKADGSFGVNAFVIGGEAVRTDMLASWQQAAPRTRLINEYGPTETVVGCCVYDVPLPSGTDLTPPGPVPIGKPIANTQLYILDARRELVPAGVIGELFIGGAGVARGYLNRPELTEARFVPDPFVAAAAAVAAVDAVAGEAGEVGEHTPRLYRTGDLVRWRADGEMEFVGRTDAQVKIRGFRIEPGEIEAVLAEHPVVAESFVMARDFGAAGRQLVAYVVAHNAHDAHSTDDADGIDVPALKRHLAARLPEYMVPAAIVTLDAFPLTPNGKIDRRALPAPEMTGTRRDLAAPRDPLEMTLAAIWQDVLGVSPVGIRDNFFDLGGHSLLAVRLLARVERAFGQAVPLATILRGPTIEQMAVLLRKANASAASALVPFQTADNSGSARPAFFCVPGAGGNPIYLSNLARALGPEQPFYGLEGAGFNGDRAPHATVEEMAAYYIDAIRAVQPEGPYHLGGHSLGGWVAFEMARQLRRQGHDVPLVAIIDTPVPAPADTSTRAGWDEAKWIAELTDRIAKLLAPELRLDEETLRASTHEQRMEAFRDALIAAGVYPAEGGLAYLRHTLDVFKAHAMVSYAPSPLPGNEAGAERILLLRTPNEPAHAAAAWTPGDATWGWSRLAQTEVVIVPGDHLAVLRPPHVALLAEHLSAYLAQALPVAA
jgi:amino acid adenylation domain-containing protein